MRPDPFGLAGSTIEGRYRLDSVIGEGGFGVVYRGFHLGFEHPIAIKCLKIPGHFIADAQKLFFDKFREEGKLLSKLSSANLSIVRVFDFGVTTSPAVQQVPYLVLEWLEGDSLEDWAVTRAKSRLPPLREREAIDLLLPAIDAIATAHLMNVAHRDIKPANLFVMRDTKASPVKVLDFGIAKAMQEGETATQVKTRTSSGFSAFSPMYGSPEQFFSKRYGSTGPWTDVHALGLCLTELVSGRPALDGEDPQELLESCVNDVRPTPRARGAHVSDAFEQVCAKALAKMPKDRYANAGDLRRALSEVAGPTAAVPAAPVAPHGAALPIASADGEHVETGAWVAAKGVVDQAAQTEVPGSTTTPVSLGIGASVSSTEMAAASTDSADPVGAPAPRAGMTDFDPEILRGFRAPELSSRASQESRALESVAPKPWSRPLLVVAVALGLAGLGFSTWAVIEGATRTDAPLQATSPGSRAVDRVENGAIVIIDQSTPEALLSGMIKAAQNNDSSGFAALCDDHLSQYDAKVFCGFATDPKNFAQWRAAARTMKVAHISMVDDSATVEFSLDRGGVKKTSAMKTKRLGGKWYIESVVAPSGSPWPDDPF